MNCTSIEGQVDSFACAACVRSLFAAVGFIVLAASGCKVGPDHHPPAPLGTNGVPSQFDGITNGVVWKPAGSEPAAVPPDWWRGFGDPELDRLVALATEANPNLAVAAARVAEARAQAAVQGAATWPAVNLTGSHIRQRNSENAFSPGVGAGVGRTYTLTSIPLEASWELDLWGRARRLREEAGATVAVSESESAAVRLSLQAEVASNVLLHRALTEQLRVLLETTNAFARSLELTRQRRRGGIGTDLEESQAAAQYEGTVAQVPAVRLDRARVEHALAALCGSPANGFAVAPSSPTAASLALPLPELVPTEWLERRPDIAAAERRVAAANAAIGVATAAFYPRFQIFAMAGLQSLHGSDVFSAPSRMWAFGPGVEWPVFSGGRLRGELAAARAKHDATVAAYRQTVLAAFRETEDALAARRELEEQWVAEKAALDAIRRARELAENRYKAGVISYLEVVAAQAAALQRELSVVRLEGERRLASVALARALGGGWTVQR